MRDGPPVKWELGDYFPSVQPQQHEQELLVYDCGMPMTPSPPIGEEIAVNHESGETLSGRRKQNLPASLYISEGSDQSGIVYWNARCEDPATLNSSGRIQLYESVARAR